MPTADLGGIRLFYELHGAGRPLVLIGGLGSDVTFLHPLVGRLGASFRVLVFDNRGAGRSDKPDAAYAVEQMAADTVRLMDAVGIERASLLGISMGGSIALATALEHPERVRSLVLVSASARKEGGLRVSVPFRLVGLAIRLLPPFRGRHAQPRYAFERQLAASRSYDCTARLAEIRVPTLIMHGRRDRTVPLALARELQAGIPDAQLALFGGGHTFFLFRERERFLETSVAFLEGVEPS